MAIFVVYILLVSFVLSGIVVVIPFVIQQIADIINILVVKINTLQEMLQNHGLGVLIESSFLPRQIKLSLLTSLESGNRVAEVQTALLENMSQIVSMGTGYIKNA